MSCIGGRVLSAIRDFVMAYFVAVALSWRASSLLG